MHVQRCLWLKITAVQQRRTGCVRCPDARSQNHSEHTENNCIRHVQLVLPGEHWTIFTWTNVFTRVRISVSDVQLCAAINCWLVPFATTVAQRLSESGQIGRRLRWWRWSCVCLTWHHWRNDNWVEFKAGSPRQWCCTNWIYEYYMSCEDAARTFEHGTKHAH